MSKRNCSVRIRADALQHNLERVRYFIAKQNANSKIMAVIKANAYGHGMFTVAQALQQADAFAVATAGEALALREHGCDKPLAAFHGFASPQQLALLAQHRIQPVVHNREQLDMLACYRGDPVSVWLKFDTGMHRLGLAPQYWRQARDIVTNAERVSLVGTMSHLANADDPENTKNNKQLNEFVNVKNHVGARASLANSAAICCLEGCCFDWVRPGIMLYGASPLRHLAANQLGLRAAMQFESTLIAIRQLKRGDAIGYGGTWHCPQDMAVGIVGAGYGDGYPRHADAGTPVMVNGQRASLVARVSMDSLFVDLRGIDASVGDPVELWGDQVAVDEVARHAGSIAYELLCQAGNAAALS